MTQLKNRRKKSLTLVVAAGLTLAGTGVAFAYWTAQGVGTGSVTTGTTTPFQITSGGFTGAPLVPGGTYASVDFTVYNPDLATQMLSGVSVTIAEADGSPWVSVPGCSADDFAATVTENPVGQIQGGQQLNGRAEIGLVNNPDVNQDGCKELASVPLYFSTVG